MPATSTLVKSVNTTPTPGNGWGSLAYRADKGDLSGCGNDAATHPVYRIDPNTGAATFLFNSVSGGFEICDGHTWDGPTQTFYVSPDVSPTVYHFSATGVPLGSFPAAAGCPNSNWTGVNPTLLLTSIEMTIAQGGTQLFDCTASNPTGLSGRVPLPCS